MLSLHLANLTYMWSESYLPTLYCFTEGDAHVHLKSCENPLPSKKNCTVVNNWSPIEDQSICSQVSSHCPLHHLLPPNPNYWVFISVIHLASLCSSNEPNLVLQRNWNYSKIQNKKFFSCLSGHWFILMIQIEA